MRNFILLVLTFGLTCSAVAQSNVAEANPTQVSTGTAGNVYISPRRLKTVVDSIVAGAVADGSVTDAKLANMGANTIKGRLSTTGVPGNLTATEVRSLLTLTTAGAAPSANAVSLYSAADYAAMKVLLALVPGTNVQAFDADLSTYAGITPSANVQSLLGAADYSAMRTLLSLVPGTNVQAFDTDLSTYAGITPAANVQSILGAADYSAIRTLLGLVIGTNVQAYDADLTTYALITPSANVQTLLGAADYAAIRTQLALTIGTNVQAYDVDLTTWAGVTPGASVAAALAVAVGTDGAFVVKGGALGQPSSGDVRNVTVFPKADVLQGSFYAADAGSNDTYAITLSPAITAYVTGTHYWFKANTANTGAATLNINAVGAKTIVKVAGGITTALADNDIRAGQLVDVVYDGTNLQMQSLLGNAASGSGDVVGPSGGVVDGEIAVYNGTGGKTIKASGVTISGGVVTAGGTGAGAFEFPQGTTQSAGTTSVLMQAPTSVTSYIITLPGATGTGYWLGTNVSGVETITRVVTIPATTGGTGLTAYTSGGIPYASSTTTLASSAALAANALVVGGGAGAAPATVTTGANILTALGVAVGSAGAPVINGGVLGTPSSGDIRNVTVLPKADVLLASVFAADAGANDTYTATLTPAITAYVTGALYSFKANTANTGAATINFNSLGAKTIKKPAGGLTTDLATNDILAGQWVILQYDGTNMLMQSLLGNAPSGAGTVTSVDQSFTGGLISVAGNPITGSGTLALSVAGTSGGIPYFSSASTWATSAALAANSLVVGGGAGVAPSTVTTGAGFLTAAGVTVNNASGLVAKDASGNVSSNNVIRGYTTTATAAGTTTLTVTSTSQQFFTGSTTQTVVLPVTSTLALGFPYTLVNNSTGAVTVQSSGANNILVMAAGTSATFTCILTSGTSAASWDAKYYGVIPASGKSLTVSNSLTVTGTDGTSHAFPSTSSSVARIDAGQTFTGASATTDWTANTQTALDSSTKLATTAFATGAGKAQRLGSHTTPDTTAGSITWTAPVYEVFANTTTTYALPAASTYDGKAVIFYCTGTNVVTIDANGSEVIVRDGTVQTGGVTMTLTGAAGNYVCMICDGVRWVTLGFKGTLAAGS